MKVICINSQGVTHIIAGKEYEATSLYHERISNNRGVYINGRRKIKIKNLKTYYADRFCAADGSDLQTIPTFEEQIEIVKLCDKNINYTGQYVKARWDYNKLKKGEFYLVEKDFLVHNNSRARKFKIHGLKYPMASYKFQEVSLSEQRNLKLHSLDGKEIKTGLSQRKFLLYTDRERTRILFEVLGTTLKRLSGTEDLQGVSLAKQMVKTGKDYDIEESDAVEFLNRSIKESLKNYGLDI